MPTFAADDGTLLAYHTFGEGKPLICLPGGPMRASAYLGDLGGLSAHRRLIVLDLRGTGGSAAPADDTSYRCDRQVDDVEALRRHLGLDQIDLLGHSAGAALAVFYATRHPGLVGRLALITPSTMAVGIPVTQPMRHEVARLRSAEPWFPGAYAALEAISAGTGGAAEFTAIRPFTYGRWDAAAQAHSAAGDGQRNPDAGAIYASEGAYPPEAVREALATFGAPALLVAGDLDVSTPEPAIAEHAKLFPDATYVVLPGTGHYPWLDDPGRFVATVAAFLD
ncbi:hydrolase [Sphaerisporangium melleum]|uniref:Hydrolase n=1 Tax=Sphaerisporangium melleum TaxID=321316 RepID=A0A917RBU4_9ACTN|nr:alpha/beta hydrolase [Sphaerisporangium melleum]GGK98531.1 hydrolase [Sphaerisporangium melleum]GII73750.1 hydrolase [Sphaerisporangium melleum]